VFLRGFGLGR